MKHLILAILVALSLASYALAEEDEYFYQWTDANGVIHISDNEANIPQQYQDTVKKVPKGDASLPVITTPSTESTSDLDLIYNPTEQRSWDNELRGLLEEKKKLLVNIDEKQKEYNYHSIKSPTFFNQTYAQKRITLQELGTEIDKLKMDLAEVDKGIERLMEDARKSGVATWRLENIIDEVMGEFNRSRTKEEE